MFYGQTLNAFNSRSESKGFDECCSLRILIIVYVSVVDPGRWRWCVQIRIQPFWNKRCSFRPFFSLNVSASSVSQSNAGGLFFTWRTFGNGSRAGSKIIWKVGSDSGINLSGFAKVHIWYLYFLIAVLSSSQTCMIFVIVRNGLLWFAGEVYRVPLFYPLLQSDGCSATGPCTSSRPHQGTRGWGVVKRVIWS